MDATLNALHRAQFIWTDVLRRAQGDAFGAFGLGPNECPYRVVASGLHWLLRDYADHDASPCLLIVAAPIKRPYIWDLAPSVSAIRYCLRQRLHVYLLEWMPASRNSSSNGLEEYTEAIRECVAKISGEAPGTKPFLIGHSLGGTLAAIFAASAPRALCGLVLLGAPLCFQPATSQFRDTLVSLVPSTLSETDPFPGSLLSHMSALASPGTFIWSRFMDAALSIADHHALDIHARVERWALDEVPLPGKLVHQIVEWLYRENRFYADRQIDLAWISTERNSPHIMSLKSTNFSGISFRTCYAHWCADSLVARRHFALSRFDFRSFRVSVGKMTPGRGGYQSTNLPYTNEQIPESYESLADSNVRGIYFRGNPG